MGFCKCRHLLTVKSIFLIFFMHLNWFGKHLNLKYERKLKFFKIFHKSWNFWVSNIPTLKFRDLWNILKMFSFCLYFRFRCLPNQLRCIKKIRKIDFTGNKWRHLQNPIFVVFEHFWATATENCSYARYNNLRTMWTQFYKVFYCQHQLNSEGIREVQNVPNLKIFANYRILRQLILFNENFNPWPQKM